MDITTKIPDGVAITLTFRSDEERTRFSNLLDDIWSGKSFYDYSPKHSRRGDDDSSDSATMCFDRLNRAVKAPSI